MVQLLNIKWPSIKAVTKNLTIIAFGFMVFNSCGSASKEELGTYDDPKTALLETHKVLSILSKNVNKGYQSVYTINEYEVTKNKIFTLD